MMFFDLATLFLIGGLLCFLVLVAATIAVAGVYLTMKRRK
jgi:hypothetical protein